MIDPALLKEAALILRALNHKLRQQILHLLHKNQTMPVTAIYKRLKIEQSVASQHLAILRRAGIVVTTRDGKQIFYAVDYKRLENIQSLAGQML